MSDTATQALLVQQRVEIETLREQVRLLERQLVPSEWRELPAGGNTTGGDRQPGTSAETAASMLVAHSLRGEGFDASEDGTGRGTPLVPIAFSSKDYGADATDNVAPTLRAMGHAESHANAGGQMAVAIQERAVSENPLSGPDGAGVRDDGASYTLEARSVPQAVAWSIMPGGPVGGNQGGDYIQENWAVRRLTPTECERLQGFKDNYTLIPYGKALRGAAKEELAAYFERTGQFMKEVSEGEWVFDRDSFEGAWPRMAADGPRYKALGNSMAVNVMRIIGERIALVDAMEVAS